MTVQEPQLAPHTTAPVDLQSAPESESFDLREMLEVAYRRRWIALGSIAIVFALGMLYTLLKAPVYEASGSILVISDQRSGVDELQILQNLEALTQSRSIETQVEIVSSPEVLTKAFEALSPEDQERGIGPSVVKINAKKGNDIITITTRAYSPESAANYVNSIVQTYLDLNLQQNRQAMRQAREYVEERLNLAKADFNEANLALTRYKQATGLVAPDAQHSQVAANIAGLQMELDEARASYQATGKSLAVLKDQMQTMQADLVTGTQLRRNPQLAAALAELDTLQQERVRLLQEYTPASPEVTAVDGQIRGLEKRIQQIAETVVEGQSVSRHPVRDALLKEYATSLANEAAQQARIGALTGALATRQAEVKALPEQERRLTELTMGLELQKSVVNMLTQKYFTLLISEGSTLPSARVVTAAMPRENPVSPRVKRDAILFLLLGVLISFGVVMLVERLDDRVHDRETVEKLTRLTTMGAVPLLTDEDQKVIDADDKYSLLLEQFRVLRNNISFSFIDRPRRMLAVTSTGPGEGKSTCCANLGIVMARDGKKVLIVDCDLHRPSIHTLMKVPQDIGLTNVLMGTATLDQALAETAHEGLDFLPTGIPLPPNPSELLNAHNTRQLFQTLSERYDIVILDCPPSLKMSDVQIISTIVDGMLLLFSENQTSKRGLLMTYHALAQIGAPLIGLIVNRVVPRRYHYGYSYYGYGYGGYGGYGQTSDDAAGEGGRGKGARKSRRAKK